MDIIKKLAEELQIRPGQAQAAVKLIDEGNTIPFISRYRKEATGALNDEVLRNLYERLNYLRNLEEKKEQVLSTIEEQGKLTEELKGLQEEILVNYGRGRFIVAVHKENGMPMLKQKNGDAYQPIFTDILEFRKFNKEDQFKTMAIEAKNVPKMLVNEAKGVVINPYGVNLQIPIVRPEEPQEKK